MKKLIVVLVVLLLVLSCSRDKSPSAPSGMAPVICYGTSFGECLGYCQRDMVIQNGLVLFTKSSWQPGYPDLTIARELTTKEWSQLLKNIDWPEFQKLPDIIGCPDCTDGGAEWIEIKYPDTAKNVMFEYGASLEGHGTLLQQLHGIFARMEAALDTAGNPEI